jgi:hypothetical protein
MLPEIFVARIWIWPPLKSVTFRVKAALTRTGRKIVNMATVKEMVKFFTTRRAVA